MLAISKNTKLLIFDCDGTIANNIPVHISAWKNVLDKYNIVTIMDNIDKYHGLSSQYILRNLYKLDANLINTLVKEIEIETHKNIDQAKGIKPVIDIIKKYHKHIPMVVISGGSRKNVYKTLESLNLVDYFDEIITADDSHPSKNHPKAFTLIAEKYNIDYGKCHVFEDGIPGMISALEAGMTITDMRNIDL